MKKIRKVKQKILKKKEKHDFKILRRQWLLSENFRLPSTGGNKARMRVAETHVGTSLRRGKKQTMRRKKRTTRGKVIEMAVFVDDKMYENVKKELVEGKVTEKIQDIVFTYLNSAQVMYQSERLTTKVRLVLVRLEFEDT